MGFRWNKVQVVAVGIETGSVGLLKAGLRDYQAGGDTQVTVLLVKAQSAKSEDVWSSLLEDEFKADPMTLMEMMKKLDLEKFQIENPGFDFSNAVLSKKYDSLPGM